MTLRLGAATARDALARVRVGIGALGAVAAVVLVGVACSTGDALGAERALLGVTVPFVVPLACLGLFESLHGRERGALLTEPLARHGADRHALALGVTLVTVAASALLGATLCVSAELAARPHFADAFGDLYACAWGGALVGAAYAGLYALGSAWGRAGRLWLLLADFVFGSGTGAFALPWVRGHARNLLGGRAVLGTSPWFAAVALVVITCACVRVCARRGPS